MLAPRLLFHRPLRAARRRAARARQLAVELVRAHAGQPREHGRRRARPGAGVDELAQRASASLAAAGARAGARRRRRAPPRPAAGRAAKRAASSRRCRGVTSSCSFVSSRQTATGRCGSRAASSATACAARRRGDSNATSVSLRAPAAARSSLALARQEADEAPALGGQAGGDERDEHGARPGQHLDRAPPPPGRRARARSRDLRSAACRRRRRARRRAPARICAHELRARARASLCSWKLTSRASMPWRRSSARCGACPRRPRRLPRAAPRARAASRPRGCRSGSGRRSGARPAPPEGSCRKYRVRPVPPDQADPPQYTRYRARPRLLRRGERRAARRSAPARRGAPGAAGCAG